MYRSGAGRELAASRGIAAQLYVIQLTAASLLWAGSQLHDEPTGAFESTESWLPMVVQHMASVATLTQTSTTHIPRSADQ